MLIDTKHPIAHAKVILIDRKTLIFGSYNWTRQAEKNSENVVVIKEPELVTSFLENYEYHHQHSDEPKKVAQSVEGEQHAGHAVPLPQ